MLLLKDQVGSAQKKYQEYIFKIKRGKHNQIIKRNQVRDDSSIKKNYQKKKNQANHILKMVCRGWHF